VCSHNTICGLMLYSYIEYVVYIRKYLIVSVMSHEVVSQLTSCPVVNQKSLAPTRCDVANPISGRKYTTVITFSNIKGSSRKQVNITEYFSTCPVQETENNGRGDSLRWPRDTLYPLNLALTPPTSGGHSVGIVRLRTTDHGVCC
jgi:hypothetical protein